VGRRLQIIVATPLAIPTLTCWRRRAMDSGRDNPMRAACRSPSKVRNSSALGPGAPKVSNASGQNWTCSVRQGCSYLRIFLASAALAAAPLPLAAVRT